MKYKPIIIILLSISLLGIASVIITTGNPPVGGITPPSIEEQMTENTLSANADPGTQTVNTQVLTDSQGAGLKFFGEVLTCTNKTDTEQVIDLRLNNLDVDKLSVNIYPLSSTIEILPGQVITKYLDLPSGISSLKLVSNSGDEMILQVPPCVSRGGSGNNDGTQSSFSMSTDKLDRPPAPVPELSTVALIGLGMSGLIFLIRRSKQ